MILLEIRCSILLYPGLPGETWLVSSLRLLRQIQIGMFGRRNACQRVLSQLLLRNSFPLFYIGGFHLWQWLTFLVFAGDAELIPRVSGSMEVSTCVDTDEQLMVEHLVVTRSLAPLSGEPCTTSHRLSRVNFDFGSCWSRHFVMVLFMYG